eukprot:1691876-Ditylum_brightwellii.AAC.1
MQEDHMLKEKEIEIGPDVDMYQGDRLKRPQNQLWRAIKERKQCQNDSFKLRQEFLEKLVGEEAELDPHRSKATIICYMKNQEATTRMYNILRRYLKPDQTKCCNFIEVPDLEKFKTLTQKTVTHYQRTGEYQKGAL